MASPTASVPNLEFTKINSHILLYTPPPPTKTSTTNPTDPTTILFCPWMGASMRSRALHAAFHKHHSLYPNARILLVRSDPPWFLTTPTKTRLRTLRPALDVIEADLAGDKKKILSHVFSNGGGLAHMDICNMYRENYGRILPIKALVTDSIPLRDVTYRQAWDAFSVGLPKGILWWPFAGVLVAFILLFWVLINIARQRLLHDAIRESLRDPDIIDKKAKRLYCYGLKDKIIGWKGIETEIAAARKMGIDVKFFRDEINPHVQYMIKDEKSYWDAVEDVWDATRR